MQRHFFATHHIHVENAPTADHSGLGLCLYLHINPLEANSRRLLSLIRVALTDNDQVPVTFVHLGAVLLAIGPPHDNKMHLPGQFFTPNYLKHLPRTWIAQLNHLPQSGSPLLYCSTF